MLAEAGEENFFIFGLTAQEIVEMKARNAYRPAEYYHQHPQVRAVMDAFRDDVFCQSEPGLFQWLYHRIMHNEDTYFHLPDLLAYLEVQDQIEAAYQDRNAWTKKTILNVARSGKFSSDRSIRDYARDIWNVEPVH
jgi:starch phosphorylase